MINRIEYVTRRPSRGLAPRPLSLMKTRARRGALSKATDKLRSTVETSDKLRSIVAVPRRSAA